MNRNFPIETRHSTLKRYQENYKIDLDLYLKSYEDNTEIDFLEIDLFSHSNRLERLLTKEPDYFNVRIDEGAINQRNINSQRRIIEFIKQRKFELEKETKIISPGTPAPEIDLSNSNAVQKIIYLNELGIIDLLRKELCFGQSVNNLANIITAITGEKHNTIQPYLNALINNTEAENNNPYKTTTTVVKVKNQLINLGVKPK